MLKVAAFVAKRLAKSIAFDAYIIPIVLATTTIILGVVATTTIVLASGVAAERSAPPTVRSTGRGGRQCAGDAQAACRKAKRR